MIIDIDACLDPTRIAITAAAEAGVKLHVTGSVALHLRGLLRRRAADINLATESEPDLTRLQETVLGALKRERPGYQPERTDAPSAQGNSCALVLTPPGNELVQLRISWLPEYGPLKELPEGWPVSSLSTSVVRTLQQVSSRLDPRDHTDLASLANHMGPAQLLRMTRGWLEYQAAHRREPLPDAYNRLYQQLGNCVLLNEWAFGVVGVATQQATAVKDTVVALSDELVPNAPAPPNGPLSDLSLEQLHEMRAHLLMRSFDTEDLRTLVSATQQFRLAAPYPPAEVKRVDQELRRHGHQADAPGSPPRTPGM